MITRIDEPAPPLPALVVTAQQAARVADFPMSCTPKVGALLQTLAASKPGGRILELGTGVGVGAAWLLSGMDSAARLTTVEADPVCGAVARGVLMGDHRATLHCGDAAQWLTNYDGPPFHMAFVDCRPGKFHHRERLFDLLALGGLYLVDDLLPQPTWPVDHQPRVNTFLSEIRSEPALFTAVMHYDCGLMMGVKRSE